MRKRLRGISPQRLPGLQRLLRGAQVQNHSWRVGKWGPAQVAPGWGPPPVPQPAEQRGRRPSPAPSAHRAGRWRQNCTREPFWWWRSGLLGVRGPLGWLTAPCRSEAGPSALGPCSFSSPQTGTGPARHPGSPSLPSLGDPGPCGLSSL